MLKKFKNQNTRAFMALIALLIGLNGTTVMRLSAQGTTATILGTVADSSGAVIADATIQVKNVGTGVTQSTTSDAQGRFSVADLGVGDYEVQARKQDFQPWFTRASPLPSALKAWSTSRCLSGRPSRPSRWKARYPR